MPLPQVQALQLSEEQIFSTYGTHYRTDGHGCLSVPRLASGFRVASYHDGYFGDCVVSDSPFAASQYEIVLRKRLDFLIKVIDAQLEPAKHVFLYMHIAGRERGGKASDRGWVLRGGTDARGEYRLEQFGKVIAQMRDSEFEPREASVSVFAPGLLFRGAKFDVIDPPPVLVVPELKTGCLSISIVGHDGSDVTGSYIVRLRERLDNARDETHLWFEATGRDTGWASFPKVALNTEYEAEITDGSTRQVTIVGGPSTLERSTRIELSAAPDHVVCRARIVAGDATAALLNACTVRWSGASVQAKIAQDNRIVFCVRQVDRQRFVLRATTEDGEYHGTVEAAIPPRIGTVDLGDVLCHRIVKVLRGRLVDSDDGVASQPVLAECNLVVRGTSDGTHWEEARPELNAAGEFEVSGSVSWTHVGVKLESGLYVPIPEAAYPVGTSDVKINCVRGHVLAVELIDEAGLDPNDYRVEAIDGQGNMKIGLLINSSANQARFEWKGLPNTGLRIRVKLKVSDQVVYEMDQLWPATWGSDATAMAPHKIDITGYLPRTTIVLLASDKKVIEDADGLLVVSRAGTPSVAIQIRRGRAAVVGVERPFRAMVHVAGFSRCAVEVLHASHEVELRRSIQVPIVAHGQEHVSKAEVVWLAAIPNGQAADFEMVQSSTGSWMVAASGSVARVIGERVALEVDAPGDYEVWGVIQGKTWYGEIGRLATVRVMTGSGPVTTVRIDGNAVAGARRKAGGR